MARIITPGLEPNWYVGQEVTCGACQATFEVEDDDVTWDKPRIDQQFGRIIENVIFMDCPNCGKFVAITPPVSPDAA
jgi:hypothetical protein